MKIILVTVLSLLLFSCKEKKEDCFSQCQQYLTKSNDTLIFMTCVQDCQIKENKKK